MNRREFLNFSAGGAIAAALPLPTAAIARPVAQVPRNLYVWAVAMARAGNPISVETLGSALKVSSDQADVLISRLVSRGVVGAPNALGVARSKPSVFEGSNLSSDRMRTMTKGDVKSKVTDIKNALMEDQEDVSEIEKTESVSPENSSKSEIMTSADDPAPQEVSGAARSTE